MASPSPPLIIQPRAKHTATVIWLHGLGDTGEGWCSICRDVFRGMSWVKFVFPTAPVRPVTLNMGMPMPSWFDIHGLSEAAQQDSAGIEASRAEVQRMLEAEVAAGINPARIVLAGFSQGGALALYTALRQGRRVGGVVGCSTWLVRHTEFLAGEWAVEEANKQTPVLLCHGEADPLVRMAFGKRTAAGLQGTGQPVTFKTYAGMGHSSCPEEMADVAAFLETCLPTSLSRGSSSGNLAKSLPTPKSDEEIRELGVKALKLYLSSFGIDHSACVEKHEMVTLALATVAPAAAAGEASDG